MTGQLWLFAYSLLIGVLLALVYDIGSFIFKPDKALRNITDIIYWLISSVAVFLALLRLCYGELRPYIIVAMFIGMGVYSVFISPVAHSLITLAARILGFLLSPLKYILKPVVSFFTKSLNFILFGIKHLQNRVKCAIMYFVNLFTKHRGVSNERKGSQKNRKKAQQ
jgi:spore cortex biosynthesis protein YabQ